MSSVAPCVAVRSNAVVFQGTRQFMSANRLQYAPHSLNTSDELESFLHVIVFHAIPNLKSTCPDPPSWMTCYFDHYPMAGRQCGKKSTAVEMDGYLESVPLGPSVVFSSPMDDIIALLLSRFRAHYKIRRYNVQREKPI